jgi:hypothetical protein
MHRIQCIKPFLYFYVFIFYLVLEDPVNIVHEDSVFTYQTNEKNLKVKKRLFKTFFSFLELLDIIKNDPLIML